MIKLSRIKVVLAMLKELGKRFLRGINFGMFCLLAILFVVAMGPRSKNSEDVKDYLALLGQIILLIPMVCVGFVLSEPLESAWGIPRIFPLPVCYFFIFGLIGIFFEGIENVDKNKT